MAGYCPRSFPASPFHRPGSRLAQTPRGRARKPWALPCSKARRCTSAIVGRASEGRRRGRIGGPKRLRPFAPLIPNDSQVYRATIEKRVRPKQAADHGYVKVKKLTR